MTVIYADSVFAMNTALDYLLLRACAALTGAPMTRRRLLLGAAVGGVYAVGVFLPGAGLLHTPVVRLLWSLLLPAAAFGWNRCLLRRWGVFLALSGALAGLVFLVDSLSAAPLSFPRGIPATGMDAKALLLAGSLGCWACTALLGRLVPGEGQQVFPVTLHWAGRQARLTALADSGNLLTDERGRPVLVAEMAAVQALLPEPLDRSELADPARCFARYAPRWGRLRLLPCRSLGTGLLLAVTTDWGDYLGHRVEGLLVALSPTALSNGAYQGVIRMTSQQEGAYGNRFAAAAAHTADGRPGGSALHRGQ